MHALYGAPDGKIWIGKRVTDDLISKRQNVKDDTLL